MKKNFVYYWQSFCIVNAILCLATAIVSLLYPDPLTIWKASTIGYSFCLPLIISRKIELKNHYRAIIGLFFILVVDPILEKVVPIRMYPSTPLIFLLSLIFGLLAIGNYLYRQRKDVSQ
ncbi:hypothetical protein [Streptococcus halotolerans]|uniref:hypothetical protein n=1 Tax=Streptococcus halotolerans TaxID=1814128 RepID=UPI000A945C6B|nr:hypothetical protein [Streptococcus halotolerans]